MTSEQLTLWVPEPCHAADPAPRPQPAPAALDSRRLTQLADADLANLFKQLTSNLDTAPWPDENHRRANTATQLGYVEREMQRRGIWWTHQPAGAPPAPRAPRPRTSAADRLRALRERRVEPEAGRAAGGPRLWTPGGDDIRITTIRVTGDLL
ncbi:hypothetical protein [Streptomyces sp. NPDC001389]|uniref:hypothetical protein n=1 Tax=Streptomyces sp. NPDC001389 TaxID=3364569 RepID=UPI003697CBFF